MFQSLFTWENIVTCTTWQVIVLNIVHKCSIFLNKAMVCIKQSITVFWTLLMKFQTLIMPDKEVSKQCIRNP